VRALILVLAAAAVLKLLVWWLEPRMAFFPFSGVQDTPARVGVPFTDLKVPTADGETLHGWWIEHPDPRGQVIYWHGNGGNLSLWLPVYLDIRRRGFSVLAVDYRGYGASTGRPSEQGIYRDGEAATTYFRERLRKEGIPTIYWGRSLGCAVASHAAAALAPDAVILESPFADVRSLFAGNPVMWTLSFVSTYRFATGSHLERYRGPLLVLHGDADSIIPFSAGRKVFEKAASEKKTFAVLEGADHNDLHADHPAYWAAVDRFLASLRDRVH